MGFELGPRRGVFIDISQEIKEPDQSCDKQVIEYYQSFDLIYRSLCAVLYNYVPTSGHPGGSISSGRFVASLLFDTMAYDMKDPDRQDADLISYAAGHKALGLYAMWALRNEICRIQAPDLLPENTDYQLRIEDLLGFRRNPVTQTPLFKKFHSKALDGHPTPTTPFVRLSTGASGVGLSTSLGLALGAKDYFGSNAPMVHIVEGEGGLTPGRVSEALAAAGTACLDNAILHIDWNQASIDSNQVCRSQDQPGDYVQWNPLELCFFNDWNVIYVPDGTDWKQISSAQHKATALDNGQPTAIVYKTVKGWGYGIEGKASHGAGHKLCSSGFFQALKPLLSESEKVLPHCEDEKQCSGPQGPILREECFWQALGVIRNELAKHTDLLDFFAKQLKSSKQRLTDRPRTPRLNAPSLAAAYEAAQMENGNIPSEFILEPGTSTTLRAELGKVLNYYNQKSNGAFLVASADLMGSTSVDKTGHGFGQGFFNAATNPETRLFAGGGICEDAISGLVSGLGTYGEHIGIASSYAAFMAPLGHIAARLHAIGNQARQAISREAYRPMILVCAHAGLKTGEDGPTHADPQALQLLQENFPQGTIYTLTPWDPQELWTLMTTSLAHRPAIIAPFVTRPNEIVPDRTSLELAPATAARTGIYLLKPAEDVKAPSIVLQGSGVTMTFINNVLPELLEQGLDLNIYYVACAEIFNALPESEQMRIFPEFQAQKAMGITGFTLPTMYKWIRSDLGRKMTLHPYQKGHYLGSGQADMVLAEAGLDPKGQFDGIKRFLDASAKK